MSSFKVRFWAAAVVAVSLGVAHAGPIVFDDDFEGYSLGALPTGSGSFTGNVGFEWTTFNGAPFTQNIVAGNGGQILEYTNSPGGFASARGHLAPADVPLATGRTASFSFDIRTDSLPASNARPLFIVANGGTEILDVRFHENGQVWYYGASETTTGLSHNVGQWNHVQITVSFPANSFDLTVNGVTVSGLALKLGASSVPTFNQLQFWTGGPSNVAQVDNVVAQLPEPASAALTLGTLGLVCLRRRRGAA